MKLRRSGLVRMPPETRVSRGPEILPGLPLTPGIVEMLISEREESKKGNYTVPPDPFAAGELSSYISWLQKKSYLSSTGLPRYMEAVYYERVDLQKAMPQVAGGELSAFARWAALY